MLHALVIAIGVFCGPSGICQDIALGPVGNEAQCIENIRANAGKVGGAYCQSVRDYLRPRMPIELRKSH